jgi:hypothetical protein
MTLKVTTVYLLLSVMLLRRHAPAVATVHVESAAVMDVASARVVVSAPVPLDACVVCRISWIGSRGCHWRCRLYSTIRSCMPFDIPSIFILNISTFIMQSK